MSGSGCPFFGIIVTSLVRKGEDVGGQYRVSAYVEMLLQICRDYPGLPDPRTLTACEIRFFYDGLRSELKEYTKLKPKAR